MVRWVEAFFARQIKPLLITTGGLPAQATVRVNQKTGMTTHAERRVCKPKGQTVCHAPTTNKFSLQPFSCVRYALFGKKAVIWFILISTFSIIQGHEGK